MWGWLTWGWITPLSSFFFFDKPKACLYSLLTIFLTWLRSYFQLLWQKLALSDRYLSLKSHVKGELFPLIKFSFYFLPCHYNLLVTNLPLVNNLPFWSQTSAQWHLSPRAFKPQIIIIINQMLLISSSGSEADMRASMLQHFANPVRFSDVIWNTGGHRRVTTSHTKLAATFSGDATMLALSQFSSNSDVSWCWTALWRQWSGDKSRSKR